MSVFNDLDYCPDLDCLVYDEDPRRKAEKHHFAERVAQAKEKLDYFNYLVNDLDFTKDEAMLALLWCPADLKNAKKLVEVAESNKQK